MNTSETSPCRRLILIFGDQLNRDSAAFDGADLLRDVLWMAEVSAEATYVWSHKQRIALFLSAMRHFREERRAEGWRVDYREMPRPGEDAEASPNTFEAALETSLQCWQPEQVVAVEPGEYRLREPLEACCARHEIPIQWLPDRHFLCSHDDFAQHASGRKSLRMEFYYREMRKRYKSLLDEKGQPEGGAWNFDADNRHSFGKEGPGLLPPPLRFSPDSLTREVLQTVEERFSDHPGSLEDFAWPVTRAQALEALEDFLTHRLSDFGRFQDALWTGEAFLNHSLLASSLNLHLLDPREVVEGAEREYRENRAPLASVEGFIRQILGWREYARGIYWRFMPEYLDRNALQAKEDLPAFYWTGETPMRCLQETIGQTLRYGYAHHIQRLMVTGLYALLLGVRPQEVHAWYLAVYVDAVEWVELPNTLGMSQFGDGGIMASKPYVASGKYIDRMSNYCRHCPFNPAEALGSKACPFTTLYWDFLMRHEKSLAANPRMKMQLRNLSRLTPERRQAIVAKANSLRQEPAAG
jgi:deoxyribodipyrimidine photolyase-related protein